MSLGTISFNRYFHICHPQKLKTLYTAKKTVLWIAGNVHDRIDIKIRYSKNIAIFLTLVITEIHVSIQLEWILSYSYDFEDTYVVT